MPEHSNPDDDGRHTDKVSMHSALAFLIEVQRLDMEREERELEAKRELDAKKQLAGEAPPAE